MRIASFVESHFRSALFLSDLAVISASPLFASFIRHDFSIPADALDNLFVYSLISTLSAVLVLPLLRVERELWPPASARGAVHVLLAAALTVLIAVSLTFGFNRLEGTARSLPLIQWFLMVIGMLCGRTLLSRAAGAKPARLTRVPQPGARTVLLMGLNRLTTLYLGALDALEPVPVCVAGILCQNSAMRGRRVDTIPVLGTLDELLPVMARQRTHGLAIDQIIVMLPAERLSLREREALHLAETAFGSKVDYLADRMMRVEPEEPQGAVGSRCESAHRSQDPRSPSYLRLKRIMDVAAGIIGAAVLLPVILAVAIVVALDVGFPLIFWQVRPGRNGRPMIIYKFRTMSAPLDAAGRQPSDEQRTSGVGRFLRRTRLDELPQLYNVLKGDMSLVGPRPLLPSDQPGEEHEHLRLRVSPGLTGWAQVNGGRALSAAEKAKLDAWYVENASLGLDIRILLRTACILLGRSVDTARVDPRSRVALGNGTGLPVSR